MTPAWVTPADIAAMQDAVAGLVAGWTDTLLWLRHIDDQTAGATPAVDFDAVRGQVLTTSGASFGRGWQLTTGLRTYSGYLSAVPIVGGIWNSSTTEVMTDVGIVLYSGAILVYQAAAPVQKFDIIVDPSDTTVHPAGTRYAVGDELSNAAAFGVSILRYAALEQRQPPDRIYDVPLT